MEALIDRYLTEVVPATRPPDDNHTEPDPSELIGQQCARSYRSAINKWIRPRWACREDGTTYLVRDFEHITMSTAIEKWLRLLMRSPKHPKGLAGKSVLHIFAIMKQLFKYGVKWGYLSRSPMGSKELKLVELLRGSTRRLQRPRSLTPKEFVDLLALYGIRELLAIALKAWTGGARANEGFGLQWRDINFLNREVDFQRGFVGGHVTPLKTEASREKEPLPDDVYELFVVWRRITPYRASDDWVFASPSSRTTSSR